MSAPTKILVPIDFSTFSEQALDYAMTLARPFGATVHLLNVIAIPTSGAPELGLAFTATTIGQITEANQAELARLAGRHRDGGTLGETIVRVGDPRDMILHVAEELGADLIVMGTHGRRGLSRALLGSVAEMVVRWSPIPVLTVRGRK